MRNGILISITITLERSKVKKCRQDKFIKFIKIFSLAEQSPGIRLMTLTRNYIKIIDKCKII